MPDEITYLSGKSGYCNVYDPGTDTMTTHPASDWTFPVHTEFVKRNNFLVAPFQNGVSGFHSSKPSITIQYSSLFGVAPIVGGGTYTFYLGLTPDGPKEFSVTVHVTDMTIKETAEGAPDVDLSCDSVGEFDIATV